MLLASAPAFSADIAKELNSQGFLTRKRHRRRPFA
jgi:hypothetical protein